MPPREVSVAYTSTATSHPAAFSPTAPTPGMLRRCRLLHGNRGYIVAAVPGTSGLLICWSSSCYVRYDTAHVSCLVVTAAAATSLLR